ncbi:NAD(P)-binding protein [Hyaloscypha hepaticicola]|uniref:NAD(P)-binding protein n=1 Tax=Hyaloscypha hepaticicola TaxID=2082293 RepID=A0A2J6Q511_9HELO|nr:NAD(P)-binding protein [Hyaloscypha hepaticicola]
MGNQISQAFPPEAKLTEKNLPDQTGKVFIVTGSSSGVGKELAQILYSHNAKVYLAARSEEKTNAAIESIKAAFPNSKGEAIYLHLDLDDLTTIKASADDFLSKEDKLNVLFNNAGVMIPPQGSKTKQGYELQLGTNNVAPFLFTKLLTPILIKTAKLEPPGIVRVVWTSSSIAEAGSPKNGVNMDNLDYKVDKPAWHKYGVSKAGNVLHAKEYANRYKGDGLISVALNPGNLKTPLQRHVPGWQMVLFNWILHTPIHGAYTELFAGLSPDVTQDHNGAWIIPWGRIAPIRKDLEAAGKSEKEGGTGVAAKFWEWTEEQVKPYL